MVAEGGDCVSPHLSKFLTTVHDIWFISALCNLFCLLMGGVSGAPSGAHTEASQRVGCLPSAWRAELSLKLK